MSFLQEVKGFTPVIDVVAADVGPVVALVYGVAWRYCQMSDGVCKASLKTLAGHLGVSSRTVQRHLKTLCEAGYLKDLTPELRNEPHTYADTGKVIITGLVEARLTTGGMTNCRGGHDKMFIEDTLHDSNDDETELLNKRSTTPKAARCSSATKSLEEQSPIQEESGIEDSLSNEESLSAAEMLFQRYHFCGGQEYVDALGEKAVCEAVAAIEEKQTNGEKLLNPGGLLRYFLDTAVEYQNGGGSLNGIFERWRIY